MRYLGRSVAAALIGVTTWAAAANTGSFVSDASVVQVPCGRSLSSLQPAAGSTIQLSRNCTYNDYLTITADNVTVTAYGTGALPVISLNKNGAAVNIYGSGDTVKNLTLVGVPPGTWNCGGVKTPAGHVDGVDLYPGATGDTVTSVTATGFYAGVFIMTGAAGNIVQNSTFKNNTELDTNSPTGSAGAFGVLLWGNDNTIQGNYINGNQACSLAYGLDGSAIEVYGGSGNVISSNTASNDNAFIELGSFSGHIASGNSVDNNIVSDGAAAQGMTFLVTRGSVDQNGPVYQTTAEGNTVSLTRRGDEGAVSYAWKSGDGTLLTLTGNTLNLGGNQVLYTDGGYVNGGGNTFTGTCNPSSACS
jgi:hypothetical protein